MDNSNPLKRSHVDLVDATNESNGSIEVSSIPQNNHEPKRIKSEFNCSTNDATTSDHSQQSEFPNLSSSQISSTSFSNDNNNNSNCICGSGCTVMHKLDSLQSVLTKVRFEQSRASFRLNNFEEEFRAREEEQVGTFEGNTATLFKDMGFPIQTKERLDAFNEELKNSEYRRSVIRNARIICGCRGRGDGEKLIGRLVNALIHPTIQSRFTWTGRSSLKRDSQLERKTPFFVYTDIRQLLFDLIYMADRRYSLYDLENDLKNKVFRYAYLHDPTRNTGSASKTIDLSQLIDRQHPIKLEMD